MGKIGVIIGFVLFVNASFSQQEVYIKRGLATAYGTISLSNMLNRNESNYWLSGGLALRVDDNYSIVGTSHVLVDGSSDIPFINSAYRYGFGLQRHWSKNNFDVHADFIPGLSLMRPNDQSGNERLYEYQVLPTMSVAVGARYYIWKYFNFFANVTYFKSSFRGLVDTNGKADELMFTGGLGLNLQVFNRSK